MKTSSRGFTLLEILVAVSILGLGLTVVLSAQTGVFWSYSRATRLSQAPGLLRCKMEEVELELLKEGYPLLDEQDDGECCEDIDVDDYSCSWKIEKVELPELPLDFDGVGADAGAGSGLGGADLTSGAGPLGALAALQQSGSNALGEGAGISDLATAMGESGGVQGLASMAMTLVYPDLKPMLEASIRKLTITVHWEEGLRKRELSVTQYVANPQQSAFDPLAEEQIDQASEQILGNPGALPGQGAPP